MGPYPNARTRGAVIQMLGPCLAQPQEVATPTPPAKGRIQSPMACTQMDDSAARAVRHAVPKEMAQPPFLNSEVQSIRKGTANCAVPFLIGCPILPSRASRRIFHHLYSSQLLISMSSSVSVQKALMKLAARRLLVMSGTLRSMAERRIL